VIECKFFVHDCKRLATLSSSVVSVECMDCKKALCYIYSGKEHLARYAEISCPMQSTIRALCCNQIDQS
jgi:hypothetical protein